MNTPGIAQVGWNCPNCGSAHAPWVMTCPIRAMTYPINGTTETVTTPPRCAKCGKTAYGDNPCMCVTVMAAAETGLKP